MTLFPRCWSLTLTATISLAAPAATQTLETTLPPGPGLPGVSSYTLTDLDDVNGDGLRDFAVRFPGDLSDPGLVTVYSGASRSELFSFSAPSAPTLVSSPGLASIGDWDGDGVRELALATGNGQSALAIHNGSDGTLLTEVPTPGLIPGTVLGLDDLDGDDVPDFVLIDLFQIVQVYSGADGDVLSQYPPPSSWGMHSGSLRWTTQEASTAVCFHTSLWGAWIPILSSEPSEHTLCPSVNRY